MLASSGTCGSNVVVSSASAQPGGRELVMFGSDDRGGYRRALRSRDLRRLLGSQLVSSSGSWAYNVALLVLLFDRTHSAAWVAAGSLGRFVPSLLLSAYGGVLAERFERVRLLTWVNVIAMLAQLGL